MRKRLVLLLLMKLSGLLLPSASAQSSLSLEHYYTMGVSGPVSMPVASFQAGKGFYAEGRYNYEALNTFSFYMGRTFSKESILSYSLSPIAGAVIGDLNGGSVGANISLGYKNWYIYSQPQYTFSIEGAYDNYIYSWTDITYSPLNWLSVGLSLQYTKPYKTQGFIENGFVIEAAYKKMTFPIYIFSPQSKDRSFVFGASFDLNFKKRKSSPAKDTESFNEVYPAKIIAAVPASITVAPAKAVVSAQVQAAPQTESVTKVRRVNVAISTKSEITGNLNRENAVSNNSKAANISPAINKNDKGSSAPLALSSASDSHKSQPTVLKDLSAQKKAAAVLQQSGGSSQFALLLGPFKNEDEAVVIKVRLNDTFDREIVMYSENAEYKLRIPGFYDRAEAELFSLNVSNEGCTAAASIVQYNVKQIDAIPLKNIAKPFEATKL